MTVQEALEQTGLTKEQIAALDAKVITGFSGILTTAEQAQATATAAAAKAEADRQAAIAAQEKTELERRSLNEFYETKVVPGLTSWEQEQKNLQTEAANAKALAAFYQAQNEGARTAGFIPVEAPKFTPGSVTPTAEGQRDANGRYVAGAPGATPGSPQFLEEIDQRLGNGISNVGWAMQEYQRLTGGQFLPDSFDRLAAEATAQKLPFRDYVARKYDFQGKQQAIVQKQQQEHDAKVAQEAAAKAETDWKAKMDAREQEFAAKEKTWAERNANNPDQRVVVSSKIPELQRKVETKELPDPLMMNENQRRANTAKMIRDTLSARDAA
jgi:hypothetical protein